MVAEGANGCSGGVWVTGEGGGLQLVPSGYSLVPDRHDLDLSRLYPLQKLSKIELGICFKWFGRNNKVTLE